MIFEEQKSLSSCESEWSYFHLLEPPTEICYTQLGHWRPEQWTTDCLRWSVKYRYLKSPKHQSGANLVCPTTRKDSVMLVCLLVMTRQVRYCIMQLFLFCPVQLSTLSTFFTHTLVVGPLYLHHSKVFQSIIDCCHLIGFCRIWCAGNCSTVLLALPIKICLWLHYDNGG